MDVDAYIKMVKERDGKEHDSDWLPPATLIKKFSVTKNISIDRDDSHLLVSEVRIDHGIFTTCARIVT